VPRRAAQARRAHHGDRGAAGLEGAESLLLLYDIVKTKMSADGMNLNMATPLLQGMTEILGKWPRTAGGGTMGDMRLLPPYVRRFRAGLFHPPAGP